MMAGLAIELHMSAVEFVIGLGVVIELPDGPSIGVVANGAMGAQGALMNVILFMAGTASQRIYLVARVQMALLARDGGMQADKRKACHVVIKDHALVPFLFVMAA